MIKVKYAYRIATGQGSSVVKAAEVLGDAVQDLINTGWEPTMGASFIYDKTDMCFIGYQALLFVPAHVDVTAGGHQAKDPVTPTLGDVQVFQRDTPAWKDAWEALEEEVTDINIWMYMTSKTSNDGLSWTHSFKHIETRAYKTVTTPRDI